MKKIMAGTVLTVILFSATVRPAFAAENIFQKFTNSIQSRFERLYLMLPGEKSGQAVLNETTNAMQNLKTAQVNASITADLLQQGKSLANAKFMVKGPVKMGASYDPKSYQTDANVSGEVSMEGTTYKGNVDLKIDGETLYFKLNEIPALPFLSLGDLKEQWLKTENKMSEKEVTQTMENQEKNKEAFTKLVKSSQIGSAKKETRDGHKVFVVTVTTPKAALKQYIDDVKETSTQNVEKDAKELMNWDKQLDQLSDLQSTVIVDANSFYLREYDLPFVFTPEQKAEADAQDRAMMTSSLIPGADKVDQVKVQVTMKMDQFNEPINFTVPTDAQDAQSAFQKAMMKNSGFGSSMTLPPAVPTLSGDDQIKAKMVVPTKFDLSKYKDSMSADDYAKLKELGY
jgi:hypothetical protein